MVIGFGSLFGTNLIYQPSMEGAKICNYLIYHDIGDDRKVEMQVITSRLSADVARML